MDEWRQELVGRKKEQKAQKQFIRGGRGGTRIFLAAKALRRKEEEEILTAEARESRWNRDKFPRRKNLRFEKRTKAGTARPTFRPGSAGKVTLYGLVMRL